jgi:hypothetical protein
MHYSDYIGIAILITAVFNGIVAILTALKAQKTHEVVKAVEQRVNGIMDRAVEQAHQSGISETEARLFREELSRLPKPPG